MKLEIGDGESRVRWSSLHRDAAQRSRDLQESRVRYRAGMLGLPGTGKTTTARLLAQRCGDMEYVGTRDFHTKDSPATSYIRRLFVERDVSAALPCQMEALTTRYVMQAAAVDCSIVDEPIEAVLAHTRALWRVGWLRDDEARTWLGGYEVMRKAAPKPKTLIMLTCDLNELSQRWRKRGRARDLAVEKVYLAALETALVDISSSYESAGSEVFFLDTSSLTSEEVVREVGQYLKRACE